MSIDISQFHQVFFEESFEGLEVMESGLLNLQEGTPDGEAINTIFRAAHSIKGGSGTFGFNAIAGFTHVMETLLDEMRANKRPVTRPDIEVLLRSVDCLSGMLRAARDGTDIDAPRIAATQAELEQALGKAPATASSRPVAAAAASSGWKILFRPHPHLLRTGNDPLRLIRELDGLGQLSVQTDTTALPPLAGFDPEESYLRWTLELRGDASEAAVREVFAWVDTDCDLDIQPILDDAAATADSVDSASAGMSATPAAAVATQVARPAAAGRATANGGESTSIRVGIDKVDAIINMVGELVITQSMLSRFNDSFDLSLLPKLRDGLTQLARNTRELQETVLKIRMLPISFAFNRFPRLVHDLSSKLGKKIELKLSGEQTELDKTVMEKIGDPLVHLVRNSLDHGVEMPEARRAAGKPEVGTIHLNAYHQGGNIVIEITDDGAGLNAERILNKARERGLVGPDEQLTNERIHELIFAPGFSTADQVSDISGRGVGMDVVRRNIKELGGQVEIRSTQGVGTTFSIRLPLTLAILDGQLVRVGDQTYIIPLVSIIESLQVRKDMVNTIAGRAELYRLRDQYIPVVRLYSLFGIEPESAELDRGLLVIVESDGHRIGMFVDDLLGQQQVVIKSLESNFQRVDGISGATILGDGTVAMILDIPGIIGLSGASARDIGGNAAARALNRAA
jgi:two-component system, chemotaxis family, sensor kinase CheA